MKILSKETKGKSRHRLRLQIRLQWTLPKT